MYSDPIAYFITCTCYGTWLPGDDRGWIRWHSGHQPPRPLLCHWCHDRMHEPMVILNDSERSLVETTVCDHCVYRNWELYRVNCRTTHFHVVLAAPGVDGGKVRDQLKAWSTRRLRESQQPTDECPPSRTHWWARGGSVRVIFDEGSLAAAIEYAGEGQQRGGSHAAKQQ